MNDVDEIRRLENLARWLDSRFRLPGTNLRFGLDSVLGLLPGIGDTATALPAAYLVLRARQLGVPGDILARMAVNVLVDYLIGAIPLVGDIFDFGFKANLRNIDLMKRHLETRMRAASTTGGAGAFRGPGRLS